MKLPRILGVSNFLLVLCLNLSQQTPEFIDIGFKFDFLILNMQWPTTFLKKCENKGHKYDAAKYYAHVEEFGYRFTIHGLWTGMNSKERLHK